MNRPVHWGCYCYCCLFTHNTRQVRRVGAYLGRLRGHLMSIGEPRCIITRFQYGKNLIDGLATPLGTNNGLASYKVEGFVTIQRRR